MIRAVKALTIVVFMLGTAGAAHAENFGLCSTGENDELNESLTNYDEQLQRRNLKFVYEHVYWGELPRRDVDHEDLLDFARQYTGRRVGVVFYSYRDGNLCTWLVSPHVDGGVARHVRENVDENILSLDAGGPLGGAVRDAGVERTLPADWTSRGVAVDDDHDPQAVLQDFSRHLLPPPLAEALTDGDVDTLVVIPVFAVGVIPFAALEVADTGEPLARYASVIIAPLVIAFRAEPLVADDTNAEALVVGDPRTASAGYPPLPHARAEAEFVAGRFGTSPLLGERATIATVRERALALPAVGLIHLATHGLSSPENPLDGSVLMLADGLWSAREIQKLSLTEGRPLVVLSACQTGRGKNFWAGTIGLAQAWYLAGARSVVMSLWNVDDRHTRLLMEDFASKIQSLPADRALQEAMLAARVRAEDPALWAGFGVYGFPERIAPR